jgi:hypothetical protein
MESGSLAVSPCALERSFEGFSDDFFANLFYFICPSVENLSTNDLRRAGNTGHARASTSGSGKEADLYVYVGK